MSSLFFLLLPSGDGWVHGVSNPPLFHHHYYEHQSVPHLPICIGWGISRAKSGKMRQERNNRARDRTPFQIQEILSFFPQVLPVLPILSTFCSYSLLMSIFSLSLYKSPSLLVYQSCKEFHTSIYKESNAHLTDTCF